MGCGGSKPERTVQGGADTIRLATARPATATARNTKSRSERAVHSSAGRAQSRQGPSSSAGRAKSRKGESSSGPRSAGPRSASGRRSRQQGGEARRRRVTGDDDDDQPPEDSVLLHDIATLNVYIEQHAENFFQSHQAAVRREIGWYIVQDIVLQANQPKNGTAPPSALFSLSCDQIIY
jgi:hypothetical protein